MLHGWTSTETEHAVEELQSKRTLVSAESRNCSVLLSPAGDNFFVAYFLNEINTLQRLAARLNTGVRVP
jgi:hypothetical protein